MTELRTIFGEDAELYHRSRPRYPAAVFDDLARLGAGTRVLEIGCGTGLATAGLAGIGCTVTAVEPSANMAALARRHVAVQIHLSSFEDWPLPDEPFDLVFAATAFHWVDPAVRVPKAADALRRGGFLAVLGTRHVAGGSRELFERIQSCYPGPPTYPVESERIPRDGGEFDASGRFGPVTFLRYEQELTYTTAEYLDVLHTYSDHRSLPAAKRTALYAGIGALIDGAGGRITKRYLHELRLARRR